MYQSDFEAFEKLQPELREDPAILEQLAERIKQIYPTESSRLRLAIKDSKTVRGLTKNEFSSFKLQNKSQSEIVSFINQVIPEFSPNLEELRNTRLKYGVLL